MRSGTGVVNRGWSWAAFCAALLGVGATYASSQAAAGPGTSGSDAGTVRHRFELASVRPANRDDGRNWFGARVTPSGRYEISAMPLSSLVWTAFIGTGAKASRVSDGTVKWAGSEPFDINAKLDDADLIGWDKLSDGERRERARAALRTLLEERFHLKVHAETKMEPVYVLVQAKGGTKLKEVAPPVPETPEEADARLRGRAPSTPPPGGFTMTGDEWIASAVPIRGLLGQMQHEFKLDHMLLDETGLKGYYAFDLKRSHEKDGPSFADLVEQELGLRVEPRKRLVTVYVIDAADKPSVDGAEQ